MSNILKVVLGALALLVFGAGFLLGDSRTLQTLAEPANTRATITILICVISAAFGLTILLTALFGDGTEEKEVLENRFRRAREIFVSFVGILGTIVGFYFGSADKSPPKLTVTAKVEAGRIVASAQGGTAPYRFTVKGGGKVLVDNKLSDDGWLQESLGELPADKSRVAVEVVDGKDLRGSADAASSATAPAKVSAPPAPGPSTGNPASEPAVKPPAVPAVKPPAAPAPSMAK